jgi:hypothetical protein
LGRGVFPSPNDGRLYQSALFYATCPRMRRFTMDCRVKPGNDEGASGGATDETRGWETRGVLRALFLMVRSVA